MTPVEGYSDAAGQETAWYYTAEAKGYGDILTNMQSLVAALKSGNPLPLGAAVFNLAAKLSKSAELGEIAGTLGTLNSLNGLVKSLERGDEFGALASGAGIVNYFQSTNNNHYQKRSCLLPLLCNRNTEAYDVAAANSDFLRAIA